MQPTDNEFINVYDGQIINVLLVDDHEVVRIGLRTLFDGHPRIRVVGEAGTVATAIEKCIALQPNVVLLDIRLPDGNGFDACETIQKQCPDTRVLILTSFADDQTVLNALDAGADGYLLKEIDSEGLSCAIEKVAAGQSILDPAVTRRVLARLRPGESNSSQDRIALLSPQERRVLALVAEGKTNKEIAMDMKLSDKTVKNYLSNAMDKLQVSRRSQAAAFFAQQQPQAR
jgi:two-component system, NarL family, response regulator DevR